MLFGYLSKLLCSSWCFNAKYNECPALELTKTKLNKLDSFLAKRDLKRGLSHASFLNVNKCALDVMCLKEDVHKPVGEPRTLCWLISCGNDDKVKSRGPFVI